MCFWMIDAEISMLRKVLELDHDDHADGEEDNLRTP